MVYFDMERLTLLLSFRAESPRNDPRWDFILWAFCPARRMTSPTQPIACASLGLIEISPRSWRTSFAAMDLRRRIWFRSCSWTAGITLPKKPKMNGLPLGGLKHWLEVPGA